MDKYLEANVIFSKFINYYTELKKDLPIRPSEMGVLNILVKREGRFTPLMLAELLDVSKPMVTAHILVLEKKGYIKRVASQEDKRSFFVLPTKKGVELVDLENKKMNNRLKSLENLLGEENFKTLLTLLEKASVEIKNIKGE